MVAQNLFEGADFAIPVQNSTMTDLQKQTEGASTENPTHLDTYFSEERVQIPERVCPL